MSRQRRRRPPGVVQPMVDRESAVRLLRAARGAGAPDDAIEWAFSAMPDRPAARRLRIEQLLAHKNYEAADALIAQGLRRRPTDASLSLLRARSLFAQGTLLAADRELRLVLARRPHHGAALQDAGRVAMALGHPLRAVRFLQRAATRRPDDRVRELLALAWLAAERPRTARQVVERMSHPPALLVSRLLMAEGRLLEAAETLQNACLVGSDSEQDAVVCELIDLLETTGDLNRIRRILVAVSIDRPEVLARAGTAWLSMGAFHTAAVRMAALARVAGYRGRALTVLMVAAAMLNRPTLARRALRRLRRIDEPVERSDVAETWCRGLFGRVLLDQCSARTAGADPHTGRLQRLLHEAGGVLQSELDAGGGSMPRRERWDLQHHIEVCRQVSALTGDTRAGAPAPLTDVMAVAGKGAGKGAGKIDRE